VSASRGHTGSVEAIEREEWLIVMTILGDIRAELEGIHALLRGDDDEEAEENA
jgi:hypothetical protein